MDVKVEFAFSVSLSEDAPGWRPEPLLATVDRVGSEVQATITRFKRFFT